MKTLNAILRHSRDVRSRTFGHDLVALYVAPDIMRSMRIEANPMLVQHANCTGDRFMGVEFRQVPLEAGRWFFVARDSSGKETVLP